MLAKKIAVLIAAAAVSAPAFADRDHRGHWGQGQGNGHRVVAHQPAYVVHRPVAQHYYYHRPAPRPVVVVHRPAPVVHTTYVRPHNGAAIVFGAVLGAAIVHHVITGY